MYMFTDEQKNIIGWVVTGGIAVISLAMSVLFSYCMYVFYKVIKKFEERH